MLKYSFNHWLINTILLILIVVLSSLGFITYVGYIIKEIALQDVYYNFRLYLKTYHFLLTHLR